MAGTQRLLAIAMAVFVANVPRSGKPDALGIVVQAENARLDAQAVFEGTTVFDGDRLSTGADGTLRLGIGEALLDLTANSSVVVHNNTGKAEKVLELELLSGTAVLSETAESAAEIAANSARVRPVAETRGVVQAEFVGPRELIVCARRGPTQIFFQGESASVAEGKCYRVLMNASADGAAGDQSGKKSAKRGKALVLIAVGAAAAVGINIWRETRDEESPYRP